MKRLFAVLMMALIVGSCSTDFDLTADYKEVTVVYGLLNQSERDHYIRVHRGYLDEDESALKFAQNPDSIYYGDELTVTITEKNNSQVIRSWTLNRINGDTLNPPIKKDTAGEFSSSQNILYHFNARLDPDYTYELRAENSLTGKVVTSQTKLVSNFAIQFPNNNFPIAWSAPNQYRINWENARNGEIYDLVIEFHYSIADIADPTTKVRKESFEWYAFKNRIFEEPDPRTTVPFESFLQAVKKNLDPDPSVVRYFDSLNFTFTVGTPTFADFINFNIAQSGITQNQASPRFTNVENGLGLFSGRYDKTVPRVQITDQTEDSLACGSVTGGLNFAPSSRVDSYPFCN